MRSAPLVGTTARGSETISIPPGQFLSSIAVATDSQGLPVALQVWARDIGSGMEILNGTYGNTSGQLNWTNRLNLGGYDLVGILGHETTNSWGLPILGSLGLTFRPVNVQTHTEADTCGLRLAVADNVASTGHRLDFDVSSGAGRALTYLLASPTRAAIPVGNCTLLLGNPVLLGTGLTDTAGFVRYPTIGFAGIFRDPLFIQAVQLDSAGQLRASDRMAMWCFQ